MALGALRPIGLIPRHFFTGSKAIISRESDQGALIHIGIFHFYWLQGNNLKIVSVGNAVDLESYKEVGEYSVETKEEKTERNCTRT